jgi:hypothetical protein
MMHKMIVSIMIAGLLGAYVAMLYAAAYIAVTIDDSFLKGLAM